MLNRRQFVSSLGAFAILSSTGWRANAQTIGFAGWDGPTKALFRSLQGEIFTISNAHPIGTITLTELRDGDASSLTEQFSVVFERPRDFPLMEGPYTLAHPKTGPIDLFLQPRGLDDHNRYYQAPFNLLRNVEFSIPGSVAPSPSQPATPSWGVPSWKPPVWGTGPSPRP